MLFRYDVLVLAVEGGFEERGGSLGDGRRGAAVREEARACFAP